MAGERRVLVVGSLNMDVVAVAPRIPVPGETIIGNKYLTEPGGKGANQAFAAAKLGGHVAMVGRVGEDDFGIRMRRNLSEAGCEIKGIETRPGASGVALIFVSEAGENSIIVVPGANEKLLASELAGHGDLFEGAAILLLQLETPMEAIRAAAMQAKRAQTRIILDPAPAPTESLPSDLLSLVDIVTPNETEAALLTGLEPRRLKPDEAETIGRKIEEQGAKTVILKLGDQGCLLLTGGKATMFQAPVVKAIDTTAAGDVFNAALAVALAEEQELSEACRFAVQASALSVTRLGAQAAAPSREEVAAWGRDLPH